ERWLTWTWPALARSAALVRETPNSRARAASTRSPSRPSGTNRVRVSDMRRLVSRLVPTPFGAVPVDPDTAQREHRDEEGSAHDGDVGDVADEQAEVVDEVDDV